MAETLRPLVAAAQKGDRGAMNQLAGCVDRFVRIFHGSLSQTVRIGYGSTIDFVVEGIAEALNRLSDFEYRSDGEFYAWIASHIRNRIRGVGRAAHTQKRGERPVALEALGDQVADQEAGVTRRVHGQEIRDALGRAIVELQVEHPDEMEVVLRKVLEGESWPQIKAALDLTSEKRARTLFVHGLEHLRGPVEKQLGSDAFEDLLGV